MAGRSRINGVGRQQKQNKRAATSFADKFAIIQHYEATHDMQATVLKFYADLDEAERRAKARVVYRWLQLKDAIATHASSARTKHQSRIRHVGSATTLGVDGEKQLVRWLKERRRSGEQVSTEMLRVRALQVAKERNVPEGAFAASGTWQKSFLDRNKKHLRGDADAEDTEEEENDQGYEAGGDDVAPSDGGKPAAATNTHKNDIAKPQAPAKERAASFKAVLPTTEPMQQPSVEPSSQPEQQPPLPAAPAKSQSVKPKQHKSVAEVPVSVSAAPLAAAIPPVLPQKAPAAVLPAPALAVIAIPAPAAPVLPSAATTAAVQQFNTTPVKESPAAAAAVDAEECELKKRKAEIEDRKAELLNESIRCDNSLKKIRIAEENMFARKRLRDAGIPQDEIDAMLPVQRE